MTTAARRPGSVGLLFLVALWALIAPWGCSVQPPPVESPVEPPPSFSASDGVEAPERWWTAFGDPALDRLVERALADNLELAQVWYRLREARAVAVRAGSDRFPDVDALATGSVRRFGDGGDRGGGFGDGFGGDPDGADGDEELRLGLTATYEVDLWGRIGSRVEAEQLRASAALADYRTAGLSLSAEVTRTWFQWIEAREQLALLDRQLEANRQILGLLENRFGAGQIRGVDVLRQRQLLEATRARRIDAESRLAVLEHLLAVLLGRPPGEASSLLAEVAAPAGIEADAVVAADADAGSDNPEPIAATLLPSLPPLPPLPDAGLPADLVRRRPDVRAAWLRLQATDRDLAAALAERYPRLTLTAFADADVSDLLDAWARSLTADLLAPLLRAGELEAEADRAEAVRRQALLGYAQATLIAFREVEDGLVQEARQAERVASLERQVELTEQALERLRMQYLSGLGDYIDVLTALSEAQQVRRDLVTARRVLLERRVALYRALAGGFETERESSESSDVRPAAPGASGSGDDPRASDPRETRPDR